MNASDAPNPAGVTGFRATLRRDWTLALIVAAAAIFVRAVVLAQIRSTVFGSHVIMDAFGYQAWSLDIAGGNWLGSRVFYQEPLYPYLLALMHLAFGPGLLSVFVVQLIVGAANCVLVQMLAARVTGRRIVGLVAGLLLAFCQTMVFYEVQVLKPVWEILFLLLFVHALVSALERRRTWLWVASGALLALLGLTRGNALVYAPFVMVWAWFALRELSRAKRAKILALFAAGLATPLVAVMLRNAAVGGDFVLSSSHAGFNFYIGNNADSDGGYRAVPGVQEDPRFEGTDARIVASARAGRALKPGEVSAWWFAQAGQFIGRRPIDWLKLEGLKLAKFFNAVEVPDTWSPGFFAQSAPRLRLAFVTYAMLMPAAVVGLVLMWKLGARARLIHVLVLATVVSVVTFYVFGRYRMPVVPLFAVAGAYALTEFARALRTRRWLASGAMLLGAGVAAAAAIIPLPTNTTPGEAAAVERFNLGLIYFERLHDAARAQQEWERALELCPTRSEVMSSLAYGYLKQGRVDDARELLYRAIRANDANANAHFLLAGIYVSERKPMNAVVELKKAIDARPAFLEAWRSLAMLRLEGGDYDAGARELERAAALFPDEEIVWLHLGACYYGMQDVPRARAAWNRALALASTPEARSGVEACLRRLPPEGSR